MLCNLSRVSNYFIKHPICSTLTKCNNNDRFLKIISVILLVKNYLINTLSLFIRTDFKIMRLINFTNLVN